MWGQLTMLRTPMDDLRDHDRMLAQRLVEVSKALEDASSTRKGPRTHMSMSEKVAIEDAARSQLNLAVEWAELIEKARSIPGFETFLRPTPFTSLLKHLPPSGYIVVINIHDDRCDAVALASGLENVRHIALPRFTLSKAKQYRATLTRRLHAQGLRNRGDDDVPGEKEPQEQGQEQEGGYSGEGSGERVGGRYRRSRTGDKDEIYRLLCGLWAEIVQPILSSLNILVRIFLNVLNDFLTTTYPETRRIIRTTPSKDMVVPNRSPIVSASPRGWCLWWAGVRKCS